MSKKKKDWKVEKERLQSLTLEERRKEYSSFTSLDKIPTWRKHEKSKGKEEVDEQEVLPLSDKVSLHKGDITMLEIDAIVNAANTSLLGGGGVDGCIHKAAGPCLYEECVTLNGCETGSAKITSGYALPAKYVIHTVGPVARGHVGEIQKDLLKDCYLSSLNLLREHHLRTVAFPCISTGIYGFPNDPAAKIALGTVKGWLEEHSNEVDRVIFCVFLETDFKIYNEKMSQFFSQGNDRRDESQQDEGKKSTTPSNKSKSRRTCKGEEDHEEEEKNKEPSEDIYMDSQKEEENRSDVEMLSQNFECDHSDPEEMKEKKDERAPSPECRRREERSTEGDQQCEDRDSAVDSEESRSGSAKDQAEAKSPAAQMVTVGAAQDKESPAAAVVSMETDNSAEPMEDEGVEGDPSTKEKLTSAEDVEVEMKTQGGDTQEAELTPADCCQSKDGFRSPDGP